jgi:hypothetical protein
VTIPGEKQDFAFPEIHRIFGVSGAGYETVGYYPTLVQKDLAEENGVQKCQLTIRRLAMIGRFAEKNELCVLLLGIESRDYQQDECQRGQ